MRELARQLALSIESTMVGRQKTRVLGAAECSGNSDGGRMVNCQESLSVRMLWVADTPGLSVD